MGNDRENLLCVLYSIEKKVKRITISLSNSLFGTNKIKACSSFYIKDGFFVWRGRVDSLDEVGTKMSGRGCFWALDMALFLGQAQH